MKKADGIDETNDRYELSESEIGSMIQDHAHAAAPDDNPSSTVCRRSTNHEEAERNDLNNSSECEKTNIVTWDGSHDPDNPKNWSKTRKWSIVATTCLMTFCVTFSSSVFSAAVAVTADEFNTSDEVMVLGVSLFVLGIAISESFTSITLV